MSKRADPYVLGEKLGEGSFAVVYRATRVGDTTGVKYAVKRFKIGLTPKQAADVHSAAHGESALLTALHDGGAAHPNIVQLIDLYTDEDGHACMVMTLAEGGSAKSRMEGVWGHAHDAPADASLKLFSATETTVYASHIISAINFAHDHNVVHRDVKPGNIVFSADDVAMLADFGSARIIEEVRASVGGSIAGTREYMAPEVHANEPASPASDVWSFGATALCFLTGHELSKKTTVSTQLSRAYNKRPGATWTLDAHIASELSAEETAAWGRTPEDLRRVIAACLQVDDEVRPTAAALNADPLFVEVRKLEERVRPWKTQVGQLKGDLASVHAELSDAREKCGGMEGAILAERIAHERERAAHGETKAAFEKLRADLEGERKLRAELEASLVAEREAQKSFLSHADTTLTALFAARHDAEVSVLLAGHGKDDFTQRADLELARANVKSAQAAVVALSAAFVTKYKADKTDDAERLATDRNALERGDVSATADAFMQRYATDFAASTAAVKGAEAAAADAEARMLEDRGRAAANLLNATTGATGGGASSVATGGSGPLNYELAGSIMRRDEESIFGALARHADALRTLASNLPRIITPNMTYLKELEDFCKPQSKAGFVICRSCEGTGKSHSHWEISPPCSSCGRAGQKPATWELFHIWTANRYCVFNDMKWCVTPAVAPHWAATVPSP